MKIKKCGLLIILLLLISSCIIGCAKQEVKQYTKNFIALGTTINLSVFSDDANKAKFALEEAEKRVYEIENKMSVNINSSEVNKLNLNGEGRVSEETFYVIDNALKYAKISKGKLDLTVEPLISIWGIGTDHARIPKKEELDKAKTLIDYTKVKAYKNDRKIVLGKNQKIDLGSIAKGYTADEIKNTFLNSNIKSGFINLGGNVMTLGNKVDGSSWKVGIQNPFAERDECMGIVNSSDLSIVTSGNYERFFEKDGIRYHHILDIDTGYPAQKGVVSTTIISKKGIDGDALSTTLYLLGIDKGLKLIESLKDIDAILVTEDKKVYITSNIKDKFELADKSFSVAN